MLSGEISQESLLGQEKPEGLPSPSRQLSSSTSLAWGLYRSRTLAPEVLSIMENETELPELKCPALFFFK